MGDVRALHGGEVIRPAPNEGCIASLRELLERAEAGEITGFVCASLHGDTTTSYTIAGMIGPFGLLGAIDMAKADLMDYMREVDW